MSQSKSKRLLVVFDFDWSLADQDTDRWIFEVLNPKIRREMKNLKDEIQWTDLVAQSLHKIHIEGKTREEIENALRIMPFHPAMIRALKNLKARKDINVTLFILSNSNSVFISTILQDKGISNLFDLVVTNPAEWDASGELKLRRRVDPNGPQHNCKVGCSPNMCKGEELQAYLNRRGMESFDQIAYVGDGSNDYCPAKHLRQQDILLCRMYRGLQKRIEKEGPLDCQIKLWGGAWEVEEIFNAF